MSVTEARKIPMLQSKLTAGENIVFLHEVSLLEGWVKNSRILAIVENLSSYGFFVFSICNNSCAPEVIIDYAFPINNDFKIAVDSDNGLTDISVTITFHKIKLNFEGDEKTRNFISELNRCCELSCKNETMLDYAWLSKYMNEAKLGHRTEDAKHLYLNEKHNDTMNGADLNVPRHSIARGITPIAARESAARYQMILKQDDYTYTQTFKIFVGSWNVNGQPPSCSLSDWLTVDIDPPDIYAVGFQELDLSKEAYLFNDSPREEEWLEAVIISLHPRAKYKKIALVRLVGIMLIVFVKEQHSAYIRNLATDTVGTGLMGKLGNKGGVVIRFDMHRTSLCFVNAHLAAHVEEYERRNQDYRVICSRISFPKFLPPKTIKDHDQIYWFGDLNYRITEMDASLVKKNLERNCLEEILKYDQLKQNIAAGRIFQQYTEGPINFQPTYKYDTGTNDFDSSEKNRAPAWCDRILWKGDKIEQVNYRSHPLLKISDHKPVSALFNSEIRVIDTEKYRKIHEEVMKKLDKLENEFLPQAMVDTTEIIFDQVYFMEPQTKDLIIANTGQVPVEFEFIKKLEDSSYCKEWLHIEPEVGSIKPGEKCDVHLEVHVDKRSASDLNSGKDKLYDILVLHLVRGKDIFITVTGTYVCSCFGMPLDVLSRINVPIREVSKEQLKNLEKDRNFKLGDPYPVPKEIWFLVDHLYQKALKQRHLFEQPGLHLEILQIRDWLDTGVPDKIPGSVHSVTEVLLLLLDSIPEPIIPYSLHDECMNASSSYAQSKQIIGLLPDMNRTVFLYLCSFLQELLQHSSENGLDANVLATLFGGIFIRDMQQHKHKSNSTGYRKTNQQKMTDRKKANFMYKFLVNDNSDLLSHPQ